MKKKASIVPRLELLESREAPSASPWLVETFNSTPLGRIPSNWSQWSSTGAAAFQVISTSTSMGIRDLAVSTPTASLNARSWLNTLVPANTEVSAAIYLNTLIPAQVFLRGAGLNTSSPSFYAVSVTRGLQVQLLRVLNGSVALLGQMHSATYVSGQWVRVALSAEGSTLRVQVTLMSTGQYLSSTGQWQTAPAWALTRNDTSISGVGQVGLARAASINGTVDFDNFSVMWPKYEEKFDSTPLGRLPTGWDQWSSTSSSIFSVSASHPLTAPHNLSSSVPTSGVKGRAWLALIEPADVQASTDIFVNSLIPAQVLVRGKFLDTPTPSYYSVAVTRGLQVQLLRVVNGYTSVLGQIRSADYVSSQWIHVGLSVNGFTLRAQIYRLDKAEYLNAYGQWQADPAWAITRSDTTITGAGEVGVARSAGVTGTLTFDNFSTVPFFRDTDPPTVAVTWPRSGSVLSDTVNLQAQADDDVGVAKVEFYVDDELVQTETVGSYQLSFNTRQIANGAHTLTVLAYDWAGNVGQASINFTVQNLDLVPVIPRHYSYIRIAQLDYSGNPMGTIEDQLLHSSVDLVVPADNYLSEIHTVAPTTPALTYLNISNIYQNLLTSWLSYADSHGIPREQAFFHVSQAVRFSGNSPSSEPVNWFWKVFQSGSTWTDATSRARGTQTGGVSFAGTGQSLYLGYPDQFREINVTLASGAGAGFSAALEYPTAIDSYGRPTAWGTLRALSNTTSGLTRSGQILFDPPADWKAASISGSARLYYVRFLTTSSGTPPVAKTILGRDYVNARGTTTGVIPAFDVNADLDHDGYLNDTEYAHRRPGMDARFLYESRIFYGYYGQMRFAVNPSNEAYRNWAVEYSLQFLNSVRLSSGIFMDNSSGKVPFDHATVRESTYYYGTDYGNLLHAIDRAIAPRWVLANTAGGGEGARNVIQQSHAYFEEFAIRAMAHNYQQFLDLAHLIAHRQALLPTPYAVLDSLPTGGSPTDPRTQLATLAYYYLLSDPVHTFLDIFGGFEPASTWARHWIPAITHNIGQPLAGWFSFATGLDPANRNLTYQVYGRRFGQALVLYKPLSYASGVTGTLANTTATTHYLGGTYYPLHADGTLGSAVTRITLRNGEGAILIKA
jgi:hypothetical protein